MIMLRLIGLQLKVNFGLSALRWNLKNDHKKFLGGVGLVLLVVLGIAPIFYLYLRLIQETYHAAALLGQPEVVLSLALIASSALVLIFGLTFVMSVFYFSRDLSLLVPLPLLPREILGAKFSVVLLYEYLTITPFFLPALWVYGVNTGAGPFYWAAGAAVFLLVPVIPLALASAFVLLLMGVTNLSRRRDTLRLIGLFAFLAIVLTFNFFITRIPPGEEAEFIQRILLGEEGLLRYSARIYPPALLAARALAAGGAQALFNFLYYLGVSAAGIALVLLIGQKIFYQGLIGGSEVDKGKALSREALARKTAGASSPAWAIARREIKYLVRTPIYLFNSLAMVAVVPLVLVIPIISGGGGVNQYLAWLHEAVPRMVQVLAGAGFVGVMALFAPAASSSFSREGKLFWISQVIPVPPQEQIRGKILYSLLISSLALPVVVLAAVLLRWNLSELALSLFAGMVLSIPAVTLSLLIDLLRPYLTWDSPQKAIKQNINVVLGMVAGGLLYYLLYLGGRAVYLAAAGSGLLVYLAVLAGAALAGGFCYGVLLKIAPARYRDIGV